jgi:hypothetical protein
MIPFHRFLIGTAILFCAGFAAWAFRGFARAGDLSLLVLGAGFAIGVGALAWYLKNLRRFLRRR